MKPSERLIARLREIPELKNRIRSNAKIVRTYAGYWQKSAGGWLWMIDHDHTIGSIERVTDLVKATTLSIYQHNGDTEIVSLNPQI